MGLEIKEIVFLMKEKEPRDRHTLAYTQPNPFQTRVTTCVKNSESDYYSLRSRPMLNCFHPEVAFVID